MSVALVGALLVLGYLVFMIFLGSQVTARQGTIEFGTGSGGRECSVTGIATTFPASAAIRSVAYLKDPFAPGTTITTIATFADGTSSTRDETLAEGGACIIQPIEAGLAPGHYGLEYRIGTDVVATGGFDVTP